MEAISFVLFQGWLNFLNSPFHKLSCIIISFLFGWLALRIELRNFNATKSNATVWATVVFFGRLLIAIYAVFFGGRSLEKAHSRQFFCKAGDTPYTPLTNSFAISDKRHIEFRAILAIPMELGQSNFVFWLTVSNDSVVEATNPEIGVLLPKELEMFLRVQINRTRAISTASRAASNLVEMLKDCWMLSYQMKSLRPLRTNLKPQIRSLPAFPSLDMTNALNKTWLSYG